MSGMEMGIVIQVFQSTLPRRERPCCVTYFFNYKIFQSTLPRRERLPLIYILYIALNFNPRSREGSDCSIIYIDVIDFISIHAPAKGATEKINISADTDTISIHAPAKGATCTFPIPHIPLKFQSTLPRRERLRRSVCDDLWHGFQSTLPRRERRHEWRTVLRDEYFNPRSREGSDKESGQRVHKGTISIHAPAKGATAIFHKIINLYCKTSTNTTRINSLNINKKYINRIKARILNYFFGANHLINLCKLYIRTCNL